MIIFNLISKPILSPILLQKHQTIVPEDEVYNYDSLKVAMEYFEKFAENPELMSEIDKKLFESIDNDFTTTISDA